MRIITSDDFIDVRTKIYQRGWRYLTSKLQWKALERTRSTFNDEDIASSDWWIVPAIKQRWNTRMTGSPDTLYEDHVVAQYLKERTGLRMLALGSGWCNHEMNFARHACFSEVRCVDISDQLLSAARTNATSKGLSNMVFEVADIDTYAFPEEAYDVVLFHSSLHHFKQVNDLIGNRIRKTLKSDGLLVINEYVGPNRLQWTPSQLAEVNRVLREELPASHRVRFRTRFHKSQMSGPGWLRMLITDPSEAVESEAIMPAIHARYQTVEERAIGGNLLMPLLKDIAHHFVDPSPENKALLSKLFALEDALLEREASQLVFGVYRPLL